MQTNITAARPYAQAAFEQAQQEDSLSAWSEMLHLLDTIVSDTQMQALLDNPRLDNAFLADFILEISGSHLSTTGQNFVRALAEAGRLPLAPAIHGLYEAHRASAEGVLTVSVSSAYALDAAEQKHISEVMARRYGKQVKLSTSMDKSLIGGAVIRAGDSVIDASVRGRLKQLNNELMQ